MIKYELDKPTGYIKVDRPQQTSSSPPTLYGFIPRTYCAERVADLCPSAVRGDGDPLDICVISERAIDRADITMTATVVGGLQMLDGDEADDKIIASAGPRSLLGQRHGRRAASAGPDRPSRSLFRNLQTAAPMSRPRPGSPTVTGRTGPAWSSTPHLTITRHISDRRPTQPGAGDS